MQINYYIKDTAATTDYLEIENQEDLQLLLLQYLTTMAELCVRKDATDFARWYRQANKDLPYSTRHKRNNSPESLIGGLLNNLLFSDQRDISLPQAEAVEFVTNTMSEVLNQVFDIQIEKITFKHQIIQVIK